MRAFRVLTKAGSVALETDDILAALPCQRAVGGTVVRTSDGVTLATVLRPPAEGGNERMLIRARKVRGRPRVRP